MAMPLLPGVTSGATRPMISSASSHSPRQNSVRARWSVAPSRLALLANRSAASIAVRAASAASANRPSADSEIATFASVNGTSAGA